MPLSIKAIQTGHTYRHTPGRYIQWFSWRNLGIGYILHHNGGALLTLYYLPVHAQIGLARCKFSWPTTGKNPRIYSWATSLVQVPALKVQCAKAVASQ